MTTIERSATDMSPYESLRRAARAVRHGLVALARIVVASLVRARICRRGQNRANSEPVDLPASFTSSVASPSSVRAIHSPSLVARLRAVGVDVVEVEPSLGEHLDAAVLARLQLGPQPKLLDLRDVRVVKVALFERFASAWQAPHGAVTRLGLLLDYERYIILRNVAVRRLQPIIDLGVSVGIFYAQQEDGLPGWFAGGEVSHDRLDDVIHWLRTQWRPSAIWPSVLSRTASLIQESGEIEAVPERLLELAAMARSFAGNEGAAQSAKYARAALGWIGDQPSRVRCWALRATATATLALGETETGLTLLETAIQTATVLRDPIEEASALSELGGHLLKHGYHARAENRFRAALALLSNEDPAHLQATLHHDLALALLEQCKDDDEAEFHVTVALNLRGDSRSQLASEDIALIARIRAQRASRSR